MRRKTLGLRYRLMGDAGTVSTCWAAQRGEDGRWWNQRAGKWWRRKVWNRTTMPHRRQA